MRAASGAAPVEQWAPSPMAVSPTKAVSPVARASTGPAQEASPGRWVPGLRPMGAPRPVAKSMER
jgi:hypothetical protein